MHNSKQNNKKPIRDQNGSHVDTAMDDQIMDEPCVQEWLTKLERDQHGRFSLAIAQSKGLDEKVS